MGHFEVRLSCPEVVIEKGEAQEAGESKKKKTKAIQNIDYAIK